MRQIRTSNQVGIRPNTTNLWYISALLLIQDTETNPGPRQTRTPKYPCGTCGKNVGWAAKQKGILCESCNQWYHGNCQGITSGWYELYGNTSLVWECLQCGMPNFSSGIFDLSQYEHSTVFSPISSEGGSPGVPQASSSPIHVVHHKEQSATGSLIRILNVNFRSVKNKREELELLLHDTKPDIVMGTETWLEPNIESSEIFPSDYTVYRRDRPTGN